MQMHERLKIARVAAGFDSASKAADALGINASTYRAYENGQNNFSAEDAQMMGKGLGVSAAWLLLGDGESDREPTIYPELKPLGLGSVAELAQLLSEEGRDEFLGLLLKPHELFEEVQKESEPLQFHRYLKEVTGKFPDGWRPRVILSTNGLRIAAYFAMYARYTNGKAACLLNNPANP